jgi:hypothetical protein
MVFRAKPGASGRFLRYVPIATLGDFAAAIFDTMQNWADATQITMPGFGDRVVEIRQNADEGGMNLQMPPDVVHRLAGRGTEAGINLLHGDSDTATPPFNFDAHRWMRYRNAMAGLDEFLSGMGDVWPGMQEFLATDPPPPGFPRFAPDNPADDLEATTQVMALATTLAELGHPATQGTVPHPEPELRLTPPL